MSNTLEWCLEEIGMQLCARQIELAGATMVHFDNTSQRAKNRIVFKAVKAEQKEDGPKAAIINLEVEYVTPKQVSTAASDNVMAGIDRAFGVASLDDPSGLAATSYFSVLESYEGGDSSKENVEQHRTRTRTIPFIAKLAT